MSIEGREGAYEAAFEDEKKSFLEAVDRGFASGGLDEGEIAAIQQHAVRIIDMCTSVEQLDGLNEELNAESRFNYSPMEDPKIQELFGAIEAKKKQLQG
jgi:hypothetical protein